MVAAALVATGCTDGAEPEPAPSASPRPTSPDGDESLDSAPDVAVVLPPATEVATPLESYEDAIARTRASFGDRLGSLRTVRLDGGGFRPDVLTLLADEGTSLTCAVGAGARDVASVAAMLPGRRFCSVDERIEEVPGNVVAVWFRYEEAAYVLGAAAARMLPTDQPEGTLGFLTPGAGAGAERQRLAFTEGARSVRPDVVVAVETLTVGGTDGGSVAERAASRTASLFDDRGATVVMVTAGVPVEPVLEEARQRLRLVTGIGAPLSAGVPAGFEPFVLATAHARLELGLTIPIQRYLDGWQAGSVSLGFVNEALVLTPGGSVRWNEVRDAVADLRARIERGEVAVA